tara:strand:+ start:374868 stop:375083 length:216 start_codon:yes stop_codon:yes gene_type:complete
MEPERKIRFCVNNPRNLAERNDLIAREFVNRDCLGNCTRCYETRFLEIDNRNIEGESYDEILKSDPPSDDA